MCRFASLLLLSWALLWTRMGYPPGGHGWMGGWAGSGNRECSKVKKTRCIIPTPVTAMEWVRLFFRLLYLFHLPKLPLSLPPSLYYYIMYTTYYETALSPNIST